MPTIEAISGLLAELGGWWVQRVEGLEASRERILAELDQLAQQVEPGDSVLVHFFGHGGVVRFTDASGELGDRPVFYLSAARRCTETEMTGVLDRELSAVLHRIDAVCQNLSVILDCCHSAQIVRGRIRKVATPSWARKLPVRVASEPSAWHHDHPRIVRLTAASSLRYAFARPVGDAQLGLLTEGFTTVVREAGLDVDRLTWDAVAHRVREHAIKTRGYEEQWVTLAGPRNRLLLSSEEVDLPRSVGFIPGSDPGRGWLRAGWLQGVAVGDEWGIAALTLDAHRQPRVLARAQVTAADLNRAQVRLVGEANPPAPLQGGSTALLLKSVERFPVDVERSGESLRQALDWSPYLRPATPDDESVFARVTEASAMTLSVRRETDGLAPRSLLDQTQSLTLLEDWGRSQLLSRVLDTNTSPLDPLPVHVAWGRCDADGDVRLPLAGGQLSEGERVYFELAHAGRTPESWYVCVIELDAAGRPILLSTREPDGLEIEPNHTVYLGRRHALQRAGLELRWPDLVARDQPRPVTVLVLMSLRPMELGHLVRTPELGSRDELWHWNSGVRGEQVPVLSTKWAWAKISYRFAPSRA